MFRFFILLAGLFCLVPLGASAEEKPGVPDGYVPIFRAGKINAFAASKTVLTTEEQGRIQKALKSLLDRYTSQYGLDREIYKPGTLKTLVEPHDNVDLVLFRNLEDFQKWCGMKGAGGVTVHLGQHDNVVGVPLDNGFISDEFWWVLAHEFSHVFFAHTLMLGGPTWLNEGLSEYFASTSKLYTGAEHAYFKEMLGRLEKRRAAKEANKIGDLIRMPQADFGRDEYDEAWLLAHLLVTECSTILNDLVSATRSLEMDAFADRDLVMEDLRKYSAGLLETAFGGPRTLQAAFDAHLDELLKNPAEPAKLKTRPVPLQWSPLGIEIEAKLVGTDKLVKDDDGEVYQSRSSSGSIRFRAPWPAVVRIFAAVGDDKGNWSDDYILLHVGTMKAGEKATWADELLPKYKKSKLFRVTVEWNLEQGGTYRTVKIMPFK